MQAVGKQCANMELHSVNSVSVSCLSKHFVTCDISYVQTNYPLVYDSGGTLLLVYPGELTFAYGLMLLHTSEVNLSAFIYRTVS